MKIQAYAPPPAKRDLDVRKKIILLLRRGQKAFAMSCIQFCRKSLFVSCGFHRTSPMEARPTAILNNNIVHPVWVAKIHNIVHNCAFYQTNSVNFGVFLEVTFGMQSKTLHWQRTKQLDNNSLAGKNHVILFFCLAQQQNLNLSKMMIQNVPFALPRSPTYNQIPNVFPFTHSKTHSHVFATPTFDAEIWLKKKKRCALCVGDYGISNHCHNYHSVTKAHVNSTQVNRQFPFCLERSCSVIWSKCSSACLESCTLNAFAFRLKTGEREHKFAFWKWMFEDQPTINKRWTDFLDHVLDNPSATNKSPVSWRQWCHIRAFQTKHRVYLVNNWSQNDFWQIWVAYREIIFGPKFVYNWPICH